MPQSFHLFCGELPKYLLSAAYNWSLNIFLVPNMVNKAPIIHSLQTKWYYLVNKIEENEKAEVHKPRMYH